MVYLIYCYLLLILYKTLKLRYTHIVMSLSYRELLALNEQQLEKMGVTKVTFYLFFFSQKTPKLLKMCVPGSP